MPRPPIQHPLSSLALWRDDLPRDGPLNMAIDEALLSTAVEPVLRIYRWSEPTVSFGCFVSLAEVRATVAASHPMVRRWTGGGIVSHDGDWTYSLIVPAREPLASRATSDRYRLIHQALATALQASGLNCTLAEAPHAGLGGVCFQQPVPADLICTGQKIAGAAQRRSHHGLLHQGSLQGVPAPADLAPLLAATLAASPHEADPLDTAGLSLARRLADEKYRSAAWLARRP